MPLISKQTLKSFLGENSFITGVDDIAGLSDAIAQADNMVYQKTLIAIPAVTLDAIPTLQFCSHAICLYLISFRQNLKEEEIKRRDLLYERAMNLLDKIESGDLKIYDNDGILVSSGLVQSSTFNIVDEDRSERL